MEPNNSMVAESSFILIKIKFLIPFLDSNLNDTTRAMFYLLFCRPYISVLNQEIDKNCKILTEKYLFLNWILYYISRKVFLFKNSLLQMEKWEKSVARARASFLARTIRTNQHKDEMHFAELNRSKTFYLRPARRLGT